MTYAQAITKLEELALAGSKELVRATDTLPALDRQQVYRLIKSGKLPVVRFGEYKTTKAIASEFFKQYIRVNTKASQSDSKPDSNWAQLNEEARKRVFGTR